MTPRSVIDSVKAEETLGPLVLDELHNTGHSRFPVIDGDIDHVVGMLYVQELLKVGQTAKTKTAAQAMDPTVYYIREDQTLQQALAAFLRVRHHLFVVVNEFEEYVGIVTIEAVLEQMIGKSTTENLDNYDDLRTVASSAAHHQHLRK